MESAIPLALRCPRSRPPTRGDDYSPPNPAFTARFGDALQPMTVAFLGAQFRSPEGEALARAAVGLWCDLAEHAPDHHDIAQGTDEAGFRTLVWTGYWRDAARFEQWRQGLAFGAWWNSEHRLDEACGWFMEVASPAPQRLETLYSSPDGFEGFGRLASHMSAEIREHGYWGSMRDRLPASQTEALTEALTAAAPASPVPRPNRRARVAFSAVDHLALIRSGQDWSRTAGLERERYVRDVEPVLRAGMDFLDSEAGLAIGCLSSRYLRIVDKDLHPAEKSYGLSWWASLADMERWARDHATHSAIFEGFMRLVQDMNLELALRLSHEVSVLRSSEQRFEYINCHERTGLLRS
ncbi:phenylacetaldoxime dehydratase family protein [Curvibacter gracilis]|uniref:phenylacetaldoxime dehydratase family protein n=1 Tax=Curvibacter gracilis TaxID=230310 RepID=UPI0004828C56|nr:phenylacetaldoxime dehydratase family protein [Curvibacter gracilis]